MCIRGRFQFSGCHFWCWCRAVGGVFCVVGVFGGTVPCSMFGMGVFGGTIVPSCDCWCIQFGPGMYPVPVGVCSCSIYPMVGYSSGGAVCVSSMLFSSESTRYVLLLVVVFSQLASPGTCASLSWSSGANLLYVFIFVCVLSCVCLAFFGGPFI